MKFDKTQLTSGKFPVEKFDDILEAVEFIKNEFGQIRIPRRKRARLGEALEVSKEESDTWGTIADVFSHIDTSELAKKNPKAAAIIWKTVSAVIALAFPITAPVAGLIAALPENVAGKVVELSGVATPEHIVHTVAEKKRKKTENTPEAEAAEVIEAEETPKLSE